VLINFIKNLENNYSEIQNDLKKTNKVLNESDKKFLSDRFCLKNGGLVRGSSSEFFSSLWTNLDKENINEKGFILDFTNNYISRNMLYSIFKTIEETRCSSVLILKNVGLLETIYMGNYIIL